MNNLKPTAEATPRPKLSLRELAAHYASERDRLNAEDNARDAAKYRAEITEWLVHNVDHLCGHEVELDKRIEGDDFIQIEDIRFTRYVGEYCTVLQAGVKCHECAGWAWCDAFSIENLHDFISEPRLCRTCHKLDHEPRPVSDFHPASLDEKLGQLVRQMITEELEARL